MFLSEFDYTLPDGLIARYPTEARRASRLLVVSDEIADRQFSDLTAHLREPDLLVMYDTRVIRARLEGRKTSGGRVEVLIERLQSDFEALALIRASKSPKPGTKICFADNVEAEVVSRSKDLFALRFSSPVEAFLEENGSVPLPPYLERDAEAVDGERYQTVYARQPGAVAAPTAGLHFDNEMLNEISGLGVNHAFVTLHVGAGTFQSLRDKHVESNQLHKERVQVSVGVCDAVADARAAGGRIIAVGTTSVRALESASEQGQLQPYDGETDLFIYPGYEFRSVDAMLTNFHLPKSSLLMLVSAFAGQKRTMTAYQHAVEQRYRFFSYGDAMLVFPKSI
jgi:S-adenosylmethionine:tRNA ribosyltransferase-isomerase